MPAVMKLINNLNNINTCFNNGYELRGSMGNRSSTTNNVINGGTNDSLCHVTRISTRSRLKEPLTVECNGFANSVSVRSDGVLVEKDAPGRLCRSKSKSCPGNGSQLGPLSPTDGVRPRRNIWKLPSCLLGTTAEDSRPPPLTRTTGITARSKSDPEPVKTESKSNNNIVSESKHKNDVLSTLHETSSGEIKIRSDKKLIEDNKEYYKVEVLSTKLRSTRQFVKEYENQKLKQDLETELAEQNGDLSNQSTDDQEIHVRKTRQSHLEEEKSIYLSRKNIKLRRSFENETAPEVTPVKKTRPTRFSNLDILNLEADKFMFGDPRRELEEQEHDSSPEIVTPKRKRKSHVELFLIDNLDYYKFELPASRLRNGNDFKVIQTCPEECKGTIRIDFNEVRYSFEMGIQRELWYQVFLRSRSRNKQSLWQNKVPHQSKILLPFERKQKHAPETSKVTRQPVALPPPPPEPVIVPKKRKRRLSSIIEEDSRPRKSPRCHASTQAILSNSHLPKRSLYSSSVINYDEDSCNSELSLVLHDAENFPECCEFSRHNPYSCDVRRLVDKLSKQLKLDTSKLNLCEILRDYSRSFYAPPPNDASSDCGGSSNMSTDNTSSISKKLRHKKRRVNLTGWPCRPRRKTAAKVNYNEKIPTISSSPVFIPQMTDLATAVPTTGRPLSLDEVVPQRKRGRGRPKKIKPSSHQ